jgi:hypothetical protein
VPNEPVALWYNTPSGDAVAIGRVWADDDGAIVASLNTASLPKGTYSMVAYGVWSKLTAVGEFSLSATSSVNTAQRRVVASFNPSSPE